MFINSKMHKKDCTVLDQAMAEKKRKPRDITILYDSLLGPVLLQDLCKDFSFLLLLS